MPQTVLESVLTGKLSLDLLVKWLSVDSNEDTPEDFELFCCSRSQFVAYFLTYLRTQTDNILKPTETCQNKATPDKVPPSHQNHNRSASEPNSEHDDSVYRNEHQRSTSPKRQGGRRVKTKLFNESSGAYSISSDESRINSGIERLVISSTPLKNGRPDSMQSSPVTPLSRYPNSSYDRCDTPRSSHRYSRSGEKSTISLGDFIPTNSAKMTKKKKPPRNVSSEAENLDLSTDAFPGLGSRKASSLRSEKRRIKPTNIDTTPQKSFSMNSFNSETFQLPSPLALEENVAFKHQQLQPKELSVSYDAERSILKQERHKLMEKFNILNTQAKPVTPQIKHMRKDSVEVSPDCVSVDVSKVSEKAKLDILVVVYDLLITNNYILSVGSELNFLISILLSNQYEEVIETNNQSILKTIHNCTYFAVKSLWNLRYLIEVIMEKSTLKVLGEHKRVRSFYPELAKFLLNSYGVKCEQEGVKEEKGAESFANGMVCFNIETDNSDNFPTPMSFQNFRKQRDMFYDILRWYNESQQLGAVKTTFRSRVKTLLALATSPANHAHLARLLMTHMLAECLPTTRASQQETKLSKLQRRLVGPPSHVTYSLPHFTTEELFYKEFLIFAENESFRGHLKDFLSTEICVLNSKQVINAEDKNNTTATDLSKDYSQLVKKLKLLSKFLGFLTELPYSQVPIDYSIKMGTCDSQTKNVTYKEPKEKIMENFVALRLFSQPSIDLKSILTDATNKGHLCITIPWVVSYLSMLDFTTLRIRYFHDLLACLFEIYTRKLGTDTDNAYFKKTTKIYLKLTLGWLFDLPQFPQEFFYETSFKSNMADATDNLDSIDSMLVIDESILMQFCPFLKDINGLLTTSRPFESGKDVCSFRHITPVSLNVNPEDRIRNKEKELQARLEAAFLKSLPSSNQRVLELVVDRATSGAVRRLTRALAECRDACRKMGVQCLNDKKPLQSLKELYTSQLEQLKAKSLQIALESIAPCASAAILALLPPSDTRPVVEAAAVRASEARVERWVATRWTGPAVLCKDLQAELESILLQSAELSAETKKAPSNTDQLLVPEEEFERVNVSPSTAIIELKEQVCLYLGGSLASLAPALAACARVPGNVFSRPPGQRALLHLAVDAAVIVVSRKPKDLTPDLLEKFHAIWDKLCPDRKRCDTSLSIPDRRSEISPEFRNYDDRAPTPVSDDGIQPVNMSKIVMLDVPAKTMDLTPKKMDLASKSMDLSSKSMDLTPKSMDLSSKKSFSSSKKSRSKKMCYASKNEDDLLSYFERILCPRNIVLLSEGESKGVWETMAVLLVFLLTNDYLSEDSLTEQCLAVYRQDWPQSVLGGMSQCMQCVSSKWMSAGKLTLFLEFLAEYCGDELIE